MERRQLIDRLERQCARMETCSQDVYRKALKALEGDAEAAAGVVAELRSGGYVDDGRYAAAFAREKAALTGWGPVKIRFMLRGKGIPDADIDVALEDVDEDAAARRLRKLLSDRDRQLKEDPYRRLKLLKLALSRGYPYEAADAAIKDLLAAPGA